MESDQELVASVLAGEAGAFTRLIRAYKRLVSHIVGRIVKSEADREELCQDIFIKVYQNLTYFRFQSKLSTWVGRIAYYQALNHLRKKKNAVLLYEDFQQAGEQGMSQPSATLKVRDQDATPDTGTELSERATLLGREIELLPDVFRTILSLYHQDELSYKEIGEVTGLPEGTVKSYLFRARAKLKTQLLSKYSKEEIWQ